MKIKVTAVLSLIFIVGLALHAQSKYLSVKDFGAIPNDEKDDLTAIQKCIDAAAKLKKACFIPEGKYIVNGDLWLASNAELFGEGKKTVLTFPKGMIRALKNGNKAFYYTGNYNNERIGGKVKRGTLEKAVQKGAKSLYIKTKANFKVGDWIFISNNRKDTWTILEKLSKGQKTDAYLNGSKDVLVKGQVAKITAVKANEITIDRELDSGYASGAVFGNHVGARNIYIHDFSINNNSNAKRGYAILFEQPFNAKFENLTIKSMKGGICLLHYAFRNTIKKCNITNSGNYAIKIANFCAENKVLNNDVNFITGGDCAILVMMYSKKNMVANNRISCLSKLKNFEGGVYIHATSFENKVIDNISKGATTSIGAYYGANNNLFKGNKGFNSNTGITGWYAGDNNTFEDNKFFFGNTNRKQKHTGFYSHCSQGLKLINNSFTGKLDIGALLSPQKDSSFKKIKFQKYFVSWTGLGFKSNISLDKNIFRSSKSNFVEFKFE